MGSITIPERASLPCIFSRSKTSFSPQASPVNNVTIGIVYSVTIGMVEMAGGHRGRGPIAELRAPS